MFKMSLSTACSDMLLTTGACHGTTAFIGCKARRARQAAGCAGAVGRGLALRSGSAPAGLAGATLEQTAVALGIGRATVDRCQAKVRRRLTQPVQLDPSWGGRRRAAMSVAQDREFLQHWAQAAADGGMLIVAPLRAALAQRLGLPSRIRSSIDCWHVTVGARWRPTRDIPRATR